MTLYYKKTAISLLIITASHALLSSQGLLLEPSLIRSQDSIYAQKILQYNWKNDSKLAHSLINYCPPPGNQGSTNSCTIWAAAYGALSIEHAIQKYSLDKAQSVAPLSPWYLFHLFTGNPNNACSLRATQIQVLGLMKSKGVCMATDLKVKDTCNILIDTEHELEALENRISDYRILFDANYHDAREEKMELLHKMLGQNKPIIIGVDKIDSSFWELKSHQLWSPKPGEGFYSTDGHAMVVIGYDEHSFEVMNSWGEKWGNRGFARINKDVLVNWAFNAFVLIPGKESLSFEVGEVKITEEKVDGVAQIEVPWSAPPAKEVLQIKLSPRSHFDIPVKIKWSANTERMPLLTTFLISKDATPKIVKAFYPENNRWQDIFGAQGKLVYSGKPDTLLVLISNQEHPLIKKPIFDFQKHINDSVSVIKTLERSFDNVQPLHLEFSNNGNAANVVNFSYNWNEHYFTYFYIALNRDD